MKEKDIIKLLRSGNFTIFYHDNGNCSLYKGKHKSPDELPEEEHEFNYETEGYLPIEVKLLVQALGGFADSI